MLYGNCRNAESFCLYHKGTYFIILHKGTSYETDINNICVTIYVGTTIEAIGRIFNSFLREDNFKEYLISFCNFLPTKWIY